MMQERWEPAKMNRFSDRVMTEARERAVEMIAKGVESETLDLGEQQGALTLSTDPKRLVGSEKFEIEGKTFYVGLPVEGE